MTMREKIAAALGITTHNLTADEQSASSKKPPGTSVPAAFFRPYPCATSAGSGGL